MTSWEPDEIDFEDEYDKTDPIDDADLDASMTLLNESMQVLLFQSLFKLMISSMIVF